MTSKNLNKDSKVTKSYNSYGRGISKTKCILKVLRENERPLKPKEIAFFAKTNRSTTRVYLRRLLEKGEVEQPYPQFYVTKTIHGVATDFVRVHNLVVGVDAPGLAKGVKGFEGWFGGVKLRIVFGSRRSKITGFVSCDGGMDFDKTLLVIDKVKRVIQERTGAKVSESEIKVITCELNEDRTDIRLDGLKSVTVKDFVGTLERIYNKDGGVRSEVKVKPQSLDSIFTALKGGPAFTQLLGIVYAQGKVLKEVREAIKFQNRINIEILSFLKNGEANAHRS